MQALFSGLDDPLTHFPIGQLKIVRQLEAGPKTPTQLAQNLKLTMGAVSQLVTRLRASGFVEEQIDESDRRSKKLALSPMGREMMETRSVRRAGRAAEVLSKISEEDQQILINTLKMIIEVGLGENTTVSSH